MLILSDPVMTFIIQDWQKKQQFEILGNNSQLNNHIY